MVVTRSLAFGPSLAPDILNVDPVLARSTIEREEETTMQQPRIVSRAEWLEARKALVTKEKELDAVSRPAGPRSASALPWVRVEKDYVLRRAASGKLTLSDLFDGRSQLFVKHFMMGPGQVGQCVGCSSKSTISRVPRPPAEPRRVLRGGGAGADR